MLFEDLEGNEVDPNPPRSLEQGEHFFCETVCTHACCVVLCGSIDSVRLQWVMTIHVSHCQQAWLSIERSSNI
jgi:hypothetical protein